jgi:signal transduction histidine kinase
MDPLKLVYTFSCFLLLALSGLSQPTLTLHSTERYLIGKNIGYFVDSTNALNIRGAAGQSYLPCKSDILSLGIISYNVWMRFSVRRETDQAFYLEIMTPLLERLEVYQMINGSPRKLFEGGFDKPFRDRPILNENWLYSMNLVKGGSDTFYVRGYTGFNFQIPIAVSSKDKFAEFNQWHNLFWGLYIGVMIFALLYNLFIYFSVRERRYFYYILYVLGSSVFYLTLQGFSFMFFWPNDPFWNKHAAVIICLTDIVVALFTMDFLRITRSEKGQYYFGVGLMLSFALLALANLLLPYQFTTAPAQVLSIIISLYCVYSGFKSLRRGVQTAKYFLIAWTLFMSFVIIFILAINNIIVSNFFTTHCIFIGHMTEVMLLSFALADRINALKRENEKFQQEISKTQLEIQEQTFQNISQEIHDNIGQVLSFIKINIDSIAVNLPENKRDRAVESADLITQVIQDLRNLSKSLSTEFIGEIGLEKAIQRQLQLLQKTDLYRTQLTVTGDYYKLPDEHELIIFRIVQELMNNIVNHANASRIDILMEYQVKQLRIVVEDNGKGIEEALLKSVKNRGLGIHHVQNRVKLLKGSAIFEGKRDKGTRVTLRLPKKILI